MRGKSGHSETADIEAQNGPEMTNNTIVLCSLWILSYAAPRTRVLYTVLQQHLTWNLRSCRRMQKAAGATKVAVRSTEYGIVVYCRSMRPLQSLSSRLAALSFLSLSLPSFGLTFSTECTAGRYLHLARGDLWISTEYLEYITSGRENGRHDPWRLRLARDAGRCYCSINVIWGKRSASE